MKLKELFAKPESWTQKQFARDKDGRGCGPQDARAACWCLGGGIAVCYPDNFNPVWDKILRRIDSASVIDWNDDPARTREDILALCEELDI